MHTFDLMDHPYSNGMQQLLTALYPGRLTVHKGSSLQTVRGRVSCATYASR